MMSKSNAPDLKCGQLEGGEGVGFLKVESNGYSVGKER
jgi:hypothetical protein